ncbi:MAG: hypothetical protein NW215_05150 [Hyphomicrobiales bacterium]|nr:hypothetical protein [Hyphomicrobiales bacterium]
MQTHLFSYNFDGKRWALEIKASDAEEARARLGRIAFATYDGVLVAEIPVTPAGVWAKLSRAIRSVLH